MTLLYPYIRFLFAIFILLFPVCVINAGETVITNSNYVASFSNIGLATLKAFGDSVSVFSGKSDGWGVVEVKYRVDHEDWNALETHFVRNRKLDDHQMFYTDSLIDMPLHMNRTYTVTDKGVNLRIVIFNNSYRNIELGDVALPIEWTEAYRDGSDSDPTPIDIFTKQFIYRQALSLNSSFITLSKPSGTGPFYMIMTGDNTQLEFFTYDHGYKAYIHSGAIGPEIKGNWRVPHTTQILMPGDSAVYVFNVRACRRYEEMRDLLYEDSLLDVRVAPGYVLPQGQSARIAIRSKQVINNLAAEYPFETEITFLGLSPDGRNLYDIILHHFGENMITVNYGKGQKSIIEMFSCEPIETLIKKRASFITTHQQHIKPGKWWDGLYSLWDMKFGKLRGPEDTDGFNGWREYMLACDDPILCKAPYVAAKNALYPDSSEIASLEYYICHFLWGKLQRTDKEAPYQYGIYGVPTWPIARDNTKLATVDSWTGARPKIWRTYDYPHIGKLYWHMYQIASREPEWCNYLSADAYLERCAQTFMAFFKVPLAVTNTDEAYTWGIYNECLIPEIVNELVKKGKIKEANFLRLAWEKKVHYFIYEDPYPFRSEYSFDRTAFESTYAFAKYAYEKGSNKTDAIDFMRRQHYAGLSVRGWLEPKYYISGSDCAYSDQTHDLTYMTMMGGWSILDYGLNYSRNLDWIELGYNSYLASWALMNTGTATTNYGYWYPGKINDGATGMAFNGAKSGWTWIRKFEQRGVWRYDGEIDIGYGAAFHTARTIVSNDSLFGLHVYGGVMNKKGKSLFVIPLDGVRQRLSFVSDNLRWNLSIDQDGFKADTPIRMSKDGKRVQLVLENHAALATGRNHPHKIELTFTVTKPKTVLVNNEKTVLEKHENEWTITVPIEQSLNIELKY